MKIKSLLLIVSCVALCGCNTTKFTLTRPDGTKIDGVNSRLFWSSQDYTARVTTEGADISAKQSNADAAALAAVTEGVAKGLK